MLANSIDYEINIYSNDDDAQTNRYHAVGEPVDELAHDFFRRGERDCWNCSERKLKGLETARTIQSRSRGSSCETTHHHGIQVIIHLGDLVDLAEESDAECRNDGDQSSHENSLPASPFEIQKSFHSELARVGSRHCRALACGEDADGPNVPEIVNHRNVAVNRSQVHLHCSNPKRASEEDSALVDVSINLSADEDRLRLIIKTRSVGPLA